jgi:hypothetical protein
MCSFEQKLEARGYTIAAEAIHESPQGSTTEEHTGGEESAPGGQVIK